MEAALPIAIYTPSPFNIKSIENFKLKLDKNEYNLLIEYDDNLIHFKLEQKNNFEDCLSYYYENSFDLKTMINIMDGFTN